MDSRAGAPLVWRVLGSILSLAILSFNIQHYYKYLQHYYRYLQYYYKNTMEVLQPSKRLQTCSVYMSLQCHYSHYSHYRFRGKVTKFADAVPSARIVSLYEEK